LDGVRLTLARIGIALGLSGREIRGHFERTGLERVIHHAQRQINHRANENAADRARIDYFDSSSSYDANGRKVEEVGTAKARTNKGRRGPRREGEDYAAQLLAETAGRPEQLLASGIDFSIHILQKRQSAHRQAMMVSFAFDVLFYQMPGQQFTGPLCL
jgi:hypothetical protein